MEGKWERRPGSAESLEEEEKVMRPCVGGSNVQALFFPLGP